jgi:hypothetical protein
MPPQDLVKRGRAALLNPADHEIDAMIHGGAASRSCGGVS